MTEEDKYALKEFMRGVGVFAACAGILVTILLSIVYFTSSEEPMSSSFEVVDKYKECDVVRYAPNQAATYKYLLYCEGNK